MACCKTVSDSFDDTSLAPPRNGKSLVSWSTPAVSTHVGSTLGSTAVANTLRSLSHHFLGDFFPKVRHQKQLFAGSQTLHVKLWYNSYSCCFIKSMQSDVVGYEPRHNTPEQHCAHLRNGYSSCLIRWARQTSTGNAS